MGRHDQLFKELLEAFFGDFLHIVAPRVARRLCLDEARFLPREHFTDRPEGERRELDLVARVPAVTEKTEKKGTQGQAGALLVHVEVEVRARKGMGRRMWDYAMLLRLKHRCPVLSIVLYLQGGPPGLEEVVVRDRLLGDELASFRYLAFGLAGCDAGAYLARPEPLAWALAALMRPPAGRAAHLKLQCLRRIQRADLDEARRFLLVNCVETYLELEGEEAEEYAALLAAETNREVAAMEMTWADKLEQKVRVQGRKEGRQEGRRQGRQEGVRALVLDLLETRFGSVSTQTRRRLEAIQSADELSRLARRLLTAGSLEELGLDGR